MRYLLFVIMLLLLLPVVGCDNEAQRRARQTATAQMDHAQELMEQDADSALAILQAVDSAALTDRPAKARYSLLMAQAVDKTSGLKDMAVVQDAIDYYADHGTPTDQMLTDYYQG